jgi:MFS family permease
MMWRLRVITSWILFGAVVGPVVGTSFVSYESDTLSWSGFKAEMAANGRLALVLAIVGAVIGLVVGVVKIVKGEKEFNI